MSYDSVFDLIYDVNNQEDVPFIIVGGFPINNYRMNREMGDVDMMMVRPDFKKVLPHFKEHGYYVDVINGNVASLQTNKLSLMDIDVVFIDAVTMQKFLSGCTETKFGGRPFLVPPLEVLVAFELHSMKYHPSLKMFKDFPDIIDLIRSNGMDYESDDFKELCLKFGTREIYSKIVSAFA